VSTTGKKQDPELQLVELRRVAAQRGWNVAGEFVDVGVSGAKDRRPGLDAMMGAAHAGRIDVVAVWKFDRFARSTRHLVTALEEFHARNVAFVSVREQVDTSTPMGKAMFTIIAAIAELERDLIRERIRAGVARSRALGKKPGRVPKVAISRQRVEELLDQGLSGRAIARKLGAPPTSVRRVIKQVRQTLRDQAAEKEASPAPGEPSAEPGRITC